MIDFEALFKISYGLYIVCSGDENRGNGFISNTIFQVTAEPPQFGACCSKDNFTASLIREYSCFSVSVLHTDTPPDIFGRFGYKSGKDTDKLEGMQLQYGETGAPIVLNEAIAYFECRVVQTIDLGTHWLFIAELVQAKVLDDTKDPITYLHYRQVRKGVAPKNAPTYIDKSKLEKKDTGSGFKQYKCTACGHIYDEAIGDPDNGYKAGTRFEDLPDNWVCPVCGAEKEDFIENQ